MSAMTPSDSTTVTGGAALTVLPRSIKDGLLLSKAGKDNRETPEKIQALSQAAGNP